MEPCNSQLLGMYKSRNITYPLSYTNANLILTTSTELREMFKNYKA